MDPIVMPDGYQTSKENFVSIEEAQKDTNSRTVELPKRKKGIVDLEDVVERVNVFLEYLNRDDIRELEKDTNAFASHMMGKFVDNFDKYFQIFTTLLETKNRDKNVGKLLETIDTLRDIKKGKKSQQMEELRFQKRLAKECKIPERLLRKDLPDVDDGL